jgi:hypothetical protein
VSMRQREPFAGLVPHGTSLSTAWFVVSGVVSHS